jgi:hypothetical protein
MNAPPAIDKSDIAESETKARYVPIRLNTLSVQIAEIS